MMLSELVGDCPEIAAVRDTIGRLLRRHSSIRRPPPVLIQGETGTGKGLVAREFHRSGPRAAGPFVDVNCAAIPATLVEAEMLGFERGAFTDARQAKPGLFEAAHHGTIFLDEVGLLPEGVQTKLLKVIEEREVRRLGSTRSEPVDAWILTATSEDLLTATREHRFREDLYHRMAVLTIWLPPLRERGSDILLLAEHFLTRACADYELPPKRLSEEARGALLGYAWPGNVRELANVMERVALLSEAAEVTAEALRLPGSTARPPEKADTHGGATRLSETGGRSRAGPAAGGRDEDAVEHLEGRGGAGRAPQHPPLSPGEARPSPGKAGAAGPPLVPAGRPRRTPGTPAKVRWQRRRLTLVRAMLSDERSERRTRRQRTVGHSRAGREAAQLRGPDRGARAPGASWQPSGSSRSRTRPRGLRWPRWRSSELRRARARRRRLVRGEAGAARRAVHARSSRRDDGRRAGGQA